MNIQKKPKYLDVNKIPEELKGTGFVKDFIKHKEIQLTLREKSLLFLHLSLPCLNRCSCWSKRKQMIRLYNRGTFTTIKNLNIVNLLKRLNKVSMITY